jgi:hypothetical protein
MKAQQSVKHYIRASLWLGIDIVNILTRNPMVGEERAGRQPRKREQNKVSR